MSRTDPTRLAPNTRQAGAAMLDAGKSEVIEIQLTGRRAVRLLISWWRGMSRKERGRRVALTARAADRTGVTITIAVGWLAAEMAPHRLGGWLGRILGVPQIRIRFASPGNPMASAGTVVQPDPQAG